MIRTACAPPRCGGFSLLEVLTAFAVLVLALGVWFEIYGRGARAAAVSAQYAQAVLIAESRLVATVHGGDEAFSETGTEGDFDWRIRIRPHRLSAVDRSAWDRYDDHDDEAMRLEEVEVRVQWGARQVVLNTLRASPLAP